MMLATLKRWFKWWWSEDGLVGGAISDPRIDRCNKEIADIERRIHAGEEPLDGLMLGLHDWKREKEMLEGGKGD